MWTWTDSALSVEVTAVSVAVPSTRRHVVVADSHENPSPETLPLAQTPMMVSVRLVASIYRLAPDSTSNPPRESEISA